MRRSILFCSLLLLLGSGVVNGQGIDRVLQAPACYGRSVALGGVRLDLRGIYVYSGLLWLVFDATNRSSIDFRAGSMGFAIRDRHVLRRRARQEIRLSPVMRREKSILASDSTVRFCYGLVPRTPSNKQELVIEWGERNGDRRLQLRVRGSMLLKAKKLK